MHPLKQRKIFMNRYHELAKNVSHGWETFAIVIFFYRWR